MELLGTVAQLWRYPVKSLQGEQVERLELRSGGAVGDRLFGIVDPAAKKVLSAKRYPALLMASARLVDDGKDDGDDHDVILTLPDGSEHEARDPGVHAALSAWLDHDVRLEPPPNDMVFPMEMHTGMSDESTPIFDWPGPQGTWLDLADAHWLTTASVASAAALHPDGDWDVRRFRPTALVETATSGWPEDTWTAIELGTVHSDVLMPTPRCTMPSRAQPGVGVDKAIGTTIRDHHDNNLGVYATIALGGAVALGDTVCAR